MAGHETRAVRPQEAQDRLRIAAGSPLAIQGIFLEVIRARFEQAAGISWVWNTDPTLTDIFIETGYNEETESRNTAPAVYVTRLQSSPSKIVVGDRAGVHLPDHREVFKALMDVALNVECVSNDEGESSIIGDVVQFMLLGSQDIIQREFGFYDFSHPILGQTIPMERDQTKWVTSINFNVQFWVHWTTVPIAPLLQQIAQRITMHGSDFFKESVLTSMRRGIPR